jgi:hypothetical protein
MSEFANNFLYGMDLYCRETDTYISVKPEDFETVTVADTRIINSIATLASLADDLGEVGYRVLADAVDLAMSKLAAKYQGRTVTLNKPFRTPKGPKKFSVYTKNEKGNVVKVNFGDPDMKIKKSIPARRKSFRARHKCESPGPKWKARYWSCRMW